MAITKEQAIDILDKFDFFQGQRAGRELWNNKPYEVQEEDINAFAKDCASLKEYIADVVPKSEVEKIFAEIELEIKKALDSNYEARRIRLKNKHEKREIPPCYCGDEFICICDGKITALRGIEYFLAELKKKYTEREDKL